MNTFKVSYSEKAEIDLDNIFSFIATEYKNQKAAIKLLKKLTQTVEDLSFMADSYHFFPEEPYYNEGIRYFSIGKYSIIYKIINDTAYVIRIVNGSRDLLKVLSE